MTYQPTPDQHRPEDMRMGFIGAGHYDTGTIIHLCNDPGRRADSQWCAGTDTMVVSEATADSAVRRLSDYAWEGMRQASEPRHIARYAAVIAAAQELTGYVPRAIVRRGKR